MKNAIEYFYRLRPTNIHQNKDEYFFEIDKKYYSLKECNRSKEEINELYNLSQELYQRNIFLHQFIWNSNNDLVTVINDKKYVLMRLFITDNKKITLQDVFNISNTKIIGNFQYIKRNNWRILWMNKIDYVEYQVNENRLKFKEFNFNIDYFIGLVENAIQLLDGINNNELYLSHQRIDINMRVKDLFDPLNVVLDTNVRSISEYIKELIIIKGIEKNDLWNFLNSMRLNNVQLQLFFLRCLFVTKYFDIFEQVIHSGENIENQIGLIVNRIDDYEKFIKEIYIFLYNKQILPEIEWLKKQAL